MAATKMSVRLLRTLSSISSSVSYRPIPKSCHFRALSTNATESKAESNDASQDASKTDQATNEQIEKMEKAFNEEREKLKKQFEEVNDRYKRSLAETENVRNRMKKQVDDAKLFGIQGFCKDLLEVADILNKATESVPQDELAKNPHLKDLYDGLVMTDSQMQKLFVKNGLVKINPAEGEKFDPNIHEALFQQSVEGKEQDTVAVVTKIGYTLHHRTLRPALVGVFK